MEEEINEIRKNRLKQVEINIFENIKTSKNIIPYEKE